MVGVQILETAIMAADAVRSRVVVLDGGTLKGDKDCSRCQQLSNRAANYHPEIALAVI